MALADQTDVEAVLGRTLTADEATLIARQLEMVSSLIAVEVGQTLEEDTTEVTLTPDPYGNIRLPQIPVTAVSSVVEYGEVLAPTSYSFTRQGVLRRLLYENDDVSCCFGVWGCPVTVAYTHGYASGDVPPVLAMIVAQIAAGRIEALTVSGAVTSAAVDDVHIAYGTGSSLNGGLELTDLQRRVLAKFKPPAPVIDMVSHRP